MLQSPCHVLLVSVLIGFYCKTKFSYFFLQSTSVPFDTKPSIFAVLSPQICNRMSRTLSEITMDNVGTVGETAHALSMLSAVPDECDTKTKVPIDLTRSIFYQI